MDARRKFTIKVSLIVAMGGFLMGFDASVISGVVKFIEPEFVLSKLQLGWAVSSLTLTSTLGMAVAGPLSTSYGRRRVLKITASLYAVSALGSALAPDFTTLVIARMIGGLGVGASLIIAPMYIAEISPPAIRGRMVSFNQLNIVLGISVAFFTNYLILKLGQSEQDWTHALMLDTHQWRWMLGLELLPAVLYFGLLFIVPESPRWLIMKNREEESFYVLNRVSSEQQAKKDMHAIKESILEKQDKTKVPFSELFKPALRLVLTIAIIVAVLQQITGINSVFFYAPMIFEQSGIGTNASFSQAILVGVTNLVFTVLAILFIDRFGRKMLLGIGLTGIAISMFVLSYGFHSATYTLNPKSIDELAVHIDRSELSGLMGKTFYSDVEFKNAIVESFGEEGSKQVESDLITAAIDINALLILLGIIGFVASFAISIGPVMWVLFSELFPNYIRGLAISFVGFINSGISFLVQLVFPWELSVLGSSLTFFIYGLFAAIGLVFVIRLLPETKNKSLEELEKILISSNKNNRSFSEEQMIKTNKN
ncbi:MAG: sugar porter family MFS transporter [Bacteroidales bacterium]|nr:sugar porter family MFS transporter [Bacteroidales bacterium]MCF8344027.1 sugar porter family MFS transporter [Bacteroidales bacterium]MCF8350041.1 sugar porter family MFS transporter [Bacteroidales bacterium]MCF8375197.1 sugar porter family MFS transporter [Bacteroidales bacterium]MCF8400681.1 sugar porter family MFS transporter [Bacteroidales bacterium]